MTKCRRWQIATAYIYLKHQHVLLISDVVSIIQQYNNSLLTT